MVTKAVVKQGNRGHKILRIFLVYVAICFSNYRKSRLYCTWKERRKL